MNEGDPRLDMGNGVAKLLSDQIGAIQKVLDDDETKPTETERVLLESVRLILYIFTEDHVKVATMFKWFQPMVFISLTVATAAIVFVITGHVQINVIP